MSDSDVESILVAFFRNEMPAQLPATAERTGSGEIVAAWLSMQAAAANSDTTLSTLDRRASSETGQLAGVRATRISLDGNNQAAANQQLASRSMACVLVGLVTLIMTAVILVGSHRQADTTGLAATATNRDVKPDALVADTEERSPSDHPQPDIPGFRFSKRFPTEEGSVELRFQLRRYKIQLPPEPEVELIIPELEIEFFELQPLEVAPPARTLLPLSGSLGQ